VALGGSGNAGRQGPSGAAGDKAVLAGGAQVRARPEPVVLQVPPELLSVRLARHRLGEIGAQWGSPQRVVDDASVVLSELLSNGVLHAGTQLRVVIALEDAGGLRVEVHDESSSPLLPSLQGGAAVAAATGRGLAIVAALATSWGWSASSGEGKVVWAEIAPASGAPDDLPETALRPVQLLGVPLRLLKASAEHFDDLFRELQMARAFDADAASRAGTPLHEPSLHEPSATAGLAAWAEQVKKGLAPLHEPARRAVWEGSRRGTGAVDLELLANEGMPGALVLCEELMRGAASAARAGRLLTEPPSPEVEAWRQWLGRELQDQMAGEVPHRCPFPTLAQPKTRPQR
jgi:anti-sigma regulatory factor (Ser/Thr protein kinase)